MNLEGETIMRKALLALAAAAAVITAGSPALASAATAPAVHHARCTETPQAHEPGCAMDFAMGSHPGDIRLVIRTSVTQHVAGSWTVSCAGSKVTGGNLSGRTTIRRHLLGRVEARGECSMNAGLLPPLARGGSVTLVFSWVNR